MYLGEEKCISFSFSKILSLLNMPEFSSTTKNNGKVIKTKIIFELGNSFLKIFKISHYKELSIKNVKLSRDSIINIIDNLNEINLETLKFYLGDTLLRIIVENTNIFIEEGEKINNESNIYIKLNEKFSNDIMFYSLSLLQLPMICKPRLILKGKKDDIYYPYLLGDSNYFIL
jgi:hypothetical protein